MLVAECGSRHGSASDGNLELVPARATDTSPTTGEVVQDLSGTPSLYGWTDLEFQRVGAPMCYGDATDPSPASRDPVRPGVLVLDTARGRAIDPAVVRAQPQMVVIGTLSNLRDGSIWTDGCGIGLSFEAWDGKCYRGSWGPWGIRVDGTGTFRACPTQTPRP